MPVPGQLVSPQLRYQAKADVTRALNHAAHITNHFSNGKLAELAERPFQLVPVSQRTVDKWVAKSRDRVIWANEYNCWNRAAVAAHALIGMTGIGTTPADDAFAAAIGHYEHAHVVDSTFHAAAVFKIQNKPGMWALDLLDPRTGPVPVEEWSFGAPVVIRRPWSGTGIAASAPYVNAEGFEYSRRQLLNSWDQADKHGVTVSNRAS